MSLPSLTVTVLNYNGWAETRACLESIERNSYQNFLLVVVDNGSTDDSVPRLREWLLAPDRLPKRRLEEVEAPPPPRGLELKEGSAGADALVSHRAVLVRVHQNQGYAGGANLALECVRVSGAEYGLFVCNDVRFDSEGIVGLLNEARGSEVDMLGPVVMDASGQQILFDGRSWPGLLFGGGKLSEGARGGDCWRTAYVEGSSFLVRRRLLEARREACGYYFDPSFFMYGEDVDLGIWAGGAAFNLRTTRRVRVSHGHAKSHGGGANPYSHYYITRNRLFLAKRWLRWPLKALFHAYYIPSRLLLILLRAGRGKLGTWSSARAALKGLLHGYAGVHGRWERDG